jgi:hypothetical protein
MMLLPKEVQSYLLISSKDWILQSMQLPDKKIEELLQKGNALILPEKIPRHQQRAVTGKVSKIHNSIMKEMLKDLPSQPLELRVQT